MAAFEAEREITPRLGVERDAPFDKLANTGRRFVADNLRGALAHCASPGLDRVIEVELRAVIVRQGGRQPTLSAIARGLLQRRARDQADPGARLGCDECGVEAGRAGAHDRDVDHRVDFSGFTFAQAVSTVSVPLQDEPLSLPTPSFVARPRYG